MIPSNPICPVCNYATNPTYCQLPSPDQLQYGVVPLDSLPAAWWNAMWHETNQAVNQARGAVGSLITEVNNVLQGAGVCVNPSCTDQLYQAIDKIRQTIGSASVAGAVKSSSCPGEVSIDQYGVMTANCLGNAASLTTTARTLVGAVNELKQTYDCCFTDTATAIGGKAPTMHASDATTYGVGNADCYGHVKISDEYTCCIGNAADGVAASQEALYCVYDFAAGIAAGVASLGNTAGCALGTAAAGTAVTAARSDHVHPVPACVGYALCLRDATNSSCYIKANYGASGVTNPTWLAGWNGYELRAVQRDALTVCCASFATQACAVWYGSSVFCGYKTGCYICMVNKCNFPALLTPTRAQIATCYTNPCVVPGIRPYIGTVIPANCSFALTSLCCCCSQAAFWIAGTRVY